MGKKAKRSNTKKVRAALPAGFTAIGVGGGFGAWHDFHKDKVLIGKVVGSMDSMQQEDDDGKKKTRRIIHVQTDKGVTVSVGESHALKEMFDAFKTIKGRIVRVEFLGQKSFKNKKGKARKVNEFSVAYK